MYAGKPCFFVEIGKGCTDYKNRPKDPCKTFNCGWIQIEDMPEKFRPEVSGVIMHFNENNGNPYIGLAKAPNNPTEQYLSWAIVYARSRDINIFWFIDDQSWWLGNKDFCNQMAIEFPII